MAAVPSEIYPHIYSFLLQNKFVKTAKSFKKETLLDLTSNHLVDCDIVQWYNAFISSKTQIQKKRKQTDESNEPKAKRRKKETSSSESSIAVETKGKKTLSRERKKVNVEKKKGIGKVEKSGENKPVNKNIKVETSENDSSSSGREKSSSQSNSEEDKQESKKEKWKTKKIKTDTSCSNHGIVTSKFAVQKSSCSEEDKQAKKKRHLKAKNKSTEAVPISLSTGHDRKVSKLGIKKSSSESSSETEEESPKEKNVTRSTKKTNRITESSGNISRSDNNNKRRTKLNVITLVRANSKVEKTPKAHFSRKEARSMNTKGASKGDGHNSSSEFSSNEDEQSSDINSSSKEVEGEVQNFKSEESLKNKPTPLEDNEALSSDESSNSDISESDSESAMTVKKSSKLISDKLKGKTKSAVKVKKHQTVDSSEGRSVLSKLTPGTQTSKNRVEGSSADSSSEDKKPNSDVMKAKNIKMQQSKNIESSDESSNREKSEDGKLSRNISSTASIKRTAKRQENVAQKRCSNDSNDDDDGDDDGDDDMTWKSHKKKNIQRRTSSQETHDNAFNGRKDEEKTVCGIQAEVIPVSNSKAALRNGGNDKLKTPFRRVREEEVKVDPRLKDNSFEAKFGSRGDWGEKANQDLKFVKGKSFRHEKTKKKRGCYRGGQISTGIHSIKFDSD